MKRDFILEWFAKNSTMSRKELENDLNINYFEQGLIDSFAFLELITMCEERFKITFSDEDFSNDDIFTIGGLIKILDQSK